MQNVSLDYTVPGEAALAPRGGHAHGTDAARQGLGSAHRPDAAVRPDSAPDRSAPHPRGDDAAGLPDAERAEPQGAHARAHLRHARSHHSHHGPDAPLRRPHGGGHGRAHVQEHEGLRGAALRHGERQAGHRPRDRAGAGPQPAGHDHRLLRQVRVDGKLAKGVYAKDVILAIINILGVKGGVGYAYEYAGDTIDGMTMEERLTVCNMSIEGGARFGYVNPDAKTVEYLRGRPYAPSGAAFDRAAIWWKSVATEPGASFDDVKRIDGATLEPVVTWGINPEMSEGVSKTIPSPDAQPESERPTFREALAHMGFAAGQPIKGAKIDVAFVGSCTNGRLSDLRIAAEVAKKGKVASHVRALIVPGSQQVAKAAEAEGLHEIFQA